MFKLSCALITALFLCAATNALAESSPPLRVGVLTELTGPAAVIGEDCRKGIEVGQIAFTSGQRVPPQFIFSDTRDDVVAGLNEFRKLVLTNNAQVVLVTRSKIALGINPIAAPYGLPVIGGVGHPDFLKGNPNAVRLFPSAIQEGRFLAANVTKLKIRRIAILTLQDDWTLALTAAFKEELKRLGGVIVSEEELIPSQTDFASSALKLKALNVDAIFVNVLVAQSGPLIKKLREAGLAQLLLSNYWIQMKSTLDSVGAKGLEGSLFAQVETHKPKFVDLFRTKHPSTEITPAAYLCYAAVGTLAQIQSELNSSSEFPIVAKKDRTVHLLDGELQFRDREAQLDLVLKTLREGKVVDF